MLGIDYGHLASSSQLNSTQVGARGSASRGGVLPIPHLGLKTRGVHPPLTILPPNKKNVFASRVCVWHTKQSVGAQEDSQRLLRLSSSRSSMSWAAKNPAGRTVFEALSAAGIPGASRATTGVQ